MIRHNASARPGHDKERDSGYTEGKRAMPTQGEDRMESIYRNPVGAQSGMPLEGQQEDKSDTKAEPSRSKKTR